MSSPGRASFRTVIVGALLLVGLAALVATLLVLTASSRPVRSPVVAPSPLHPVATTFVADDTTIADCRDERCFQQAFGNMALRSGPKSALAAAARLYGDGGSPACHTVVHTIGAAALSRFDGDVARTFAAGSSLCWSGYYHGVLERSLLEVGASRPRALRAVARSLCNEVLDQEVPWVAYQCLHGLGHGLMITTGLDLPRSLDTCRRLATSWERDVCKSGVFMENVWPAFGASPWLRETDPLYPCTVVARSDRSRCYQMATTRILRFVGGDWEAVARVCSTVEEEFAYRCFRSYGRDASGNNHRDVGATLTTCRIARPFGGERDCVYAAAQDFTANFTSGVRARFLCDLVEARLAGACFEGIGSVMGGFSKTSFARAADCRSIAESTALFESCLLGVRSALPGA